MGKKIVIIGGGDIGCETADWLAGPEREIKVVEILPQVLNKMKKIPKERLLSRLIEKSVTVLTETRLISVEKNAVVIKQKDGEPFMLEADNVVISISVQSENSLLQDLKGTVKEVIAVGDASTPGNIGSAIRSATEAALKI